MADVPDKITRNLFSYSNLTLKLHVRLVNDKNEPLHTEYEYGNKQYVRLDHFSFLTLDVMLNGEWDKSKSIMITQFSMYSILQAMKKIITAVYETGIFAVKANGDVLIYSDLAKKHTQKISVLNTSSAMMIVPTIVYDENDVGYEGVNIHINKMENVAQLPIQYFEALVYTLGKIDLFHYSQLLLNYFVGYYGKSQDLFKRQPSIPSYNKNNVDFNTSNGETKANFRKADNDIMDDYFNYE